jgi:glutaredoxin
MSGSTLVPAITLAFALAATAVGCKKNEEASSGAASTAALAKPAATPNVREAPGDQLFTWVDDEGRFQVTGNVADVPPSARDVVRVNSPAIDDPDPNTVFVVDLRNVRPDGTYAVSTMGRAAFDRMAVERRKVRAPEAAAAGALDGAGDGAVIYGASWCGPCHQAQAWFKGAGVPVVEHDIEEEPEAREQMRLALEKAGRRGGSIPVIVWHGKVFVGFDAGALEAERGRK